MISRYLTEASTGEMLPEILTVGLRRTLALRYGENPHQSGALYIDPLATPGIAQADQIWGKDLSYNNILDSDGAWELVSDLPAGSCAIIKHGNPCGAACGATLADSFRTAKSSDPISAFGGIAAFNQALDLAAAEAMAEKGNFLEVIIAPEISDEVAKFFAIGRMGEERAVVGGSSRSAGECGGIFGRFGAGLWSSRRTRIRVTSGRWRRIGPTDDEAAALRFVWSVVPHVEEQRDRCW